MRTAHRRLAVLAIVPLVLAVGACGSDDKKDEDAGKAASSAGATASAAGKGGDAAPSSAAGKPGKTLTKDELTKALVISSDLPAGWNTEENTDEEESAGTAADPACQPLVDLMSATGSAKPAAQAFVDITPPEGANISYTVRLDGLGDKAAKVLSDAAKALDKCKEFKVTSDNEEGSYTAAKIAAPKLGDDSLGLQLKTTVMGQSLQLDVALARSGGVIVSAVGYDTVGGEPVKPIDAAVMKAQVDKVAAAQKG